MEVILICSILICPFNLNITVLVRLPPEKQNQEEIYTRRLIGRHWLRYLWGLARRFQNLRAGRAGWKL